MNKNYSKLKQQLLKERERLYLKANRFFTGSKKRQKIYLTIESIDFALESIETLSLLEPYFEVNSKSSVTIRNGVKEELLQYNMSLVKTNNIKKIQDIPSLECAVFKNWKDKYGSIEIFKILDEGE